MYTPPIVIVIIVNRNPAFFMASICPGALMKAWECSILQHINPWAVALSLTIRQVFLDIEGFLLESCQTATATMDKTPTDCGHVTEYLDILTHQTLE